MQTQTRTNDRTRSLRDLLSHHRTLALTRVREYRSAQEADASPQPSDELDTARALADVETHASLIERAEERLRAIDFAFNLLERHRYGTCAQCGEEIPAERLKVVPFAAYCVDCQQKQDRARHIGEGTVDEPFAHQWALPPEMAESTEESDDERVSISQERPDETEERPRVSGPHRGDGRSAKVSRATSRGDRKRAQRK
jgi:RNA polymerase-binding transcription factor